MSAEVQRPQRLVRYVNPDGTLTIEGLEFMDRMATVARDVQTGASVTGRAAAATSMSVMARYVAPPSAFNLGELVAGSNLFPCDAAGTVGATALTGTWRLQGRIGGSATVANEVSTWLRVLA